MEFCELRGANNVSTVRKTTHQEKAVTCRALGPDHQQMGDSAVSSTALLHRQFSL